MIAQAKSVCLVTEGIFSSLQINRRIDGDHPEKGLHEKELLVFDLDSYHGCVVNENEMGSLPFICFSPNWGMKM